MKKALSTIILLISLLPALAQTGNIVKLFNNNYRVGVFSNTFSYTRMAHTGDQNDDNWCLAACIQMTLDYEGLAVTQEQIIAKSFGATEEQQGGAPEMMIAINGTAPNNWGKTSHIYSENLNIDADLIFTELMNDRPLIVGIRSNGAGTSNVITALTFSIKYDADGKKTGIIPVMVTLRDPWSTASAQRIVTWTDFVNSATTLYAIKVSAIEAH